MSLLSEIGVYWRSYGCSGCRLPHEGAAGATLFRLGQAVGWQNIMRPIRTCGVPLFDPSCVCCVSQAVEPGETYSDRISVPHRGTKTRSTLGLRTLELPAVGHEYPIRLDFAELNGLRNATNMGRIE